MSTGFSKFLSCLDEELAWAQGYTLQGYTLKRKAHTWLLVVRATTPDGLAKVAFFESADRMDCYRGLYSLIHTSGSGHRWREDKFA